MGDYYNDERRRGRDTYTTTEYYDSRPSSRYDNRDHEHALVTRDQYSHRRSPSGDLVRYDYDSPRHYSHDRDHDHRRNRSHEDDYHHRQRSLSPTHLRDHNKSKKHHEDHHTAKDLAATILGGVVGSQVARRASHGESKLSTAAGALIGAWGGHELEKTWDHHEVKEKSRRRSEGRYR